MRLLVLSLLLLSLIAGCSRQPEHVLAGGKSVEERLAALKNNDPKVRKEAVEKLGNVGPGDAHVVPALQEALADKDARVRTASILALVKCGAAAAPAVPALTELQTKDADRKVRDYAKEALIAIQRNAK